MLKMCLVFWKSEPRFAYKHYAYKKEHVHNNAFLHITYRKNLPTRHHSDDRGSPG